MEEVKLGEHITIYRVPYTPLQSKNKILEDVELNKVFHRNPTTDAFGHINKKYFASFWELEKTGIDICIKLANKNNKLKNSSSFQYYYDAWINIVKAKEPVQFSNKTEEENWHNHIISNDVYSKAKYIPETVPRNIYTFVFYIQMPDNLEGTEGHLLLRDHTGEVFPVLPRENEFIIHPSEINHYPRPAYNSTKDRIVLATNVGFKGNNDKYIIE